MDRQKQDWQVALQRRRTRRLRIYLIIALLLQIESDKRESVSRDAHHLF